MRDPLAPQMFHPENVEDSAPVDSDGIPDIAPRGEGFLGWENRSDNVPDPEPQPAPEVEAQPEPTPAADPPSEDSTSQEAEGQPDESAVPDSDTEPEPEQEAKPEEAKAESKGKPDPEAVERLLKRYGGDANRVGSAYLHLQGYAGRTDEENAKLREQLDALTMVDGEGNLTVRPDAAARTLASQRGKTAAPSDPVAVSEDEVRSQVEEEFRAMLADEHFGGPEELNDNLRKVAPLIDKSVQDRMRVQQQEVMSAAMKRAYETSKIVKDFFAANPEADKYSEQIDKWYARFPEDIRHQALQFLPLEEVYRAVRLQADLPRLIEDTWSEALKRVQENVEPTDGGTPQGGEPRSQRTRTQQPTDEYAGFEQVRTSVFDRLLAAK